MIIQRKSYKDIIIIKDMFDIIIISVVLLALLIGSFTDIKTREVPDWLNFSLIPLGLGIRLIYSLITSDYSYIIS